MESKCEVGVAAVLAATTQVEVEAVSGAAVVTGYDVEAAELAATEQTEVTIEAVCEAAVESKCEVGVAAVLAAADQVEVEAVSGAAVVTGCGVEAAKLAATAQTKVTICAAEYGAMVKKQNARKKLQKRRKKKEKALNARSLIRSVEEITCA